jgi:hypothetical protein
MAPGRYIRKNIITTIFNIQVTGSAKRCAVYVVCLNWVAGAYGINLGCQGMAGPMQQGEVYGKGSAQCGEF